ncbi:hypothetical protein DFA_09722 [Cavenderia fasciculata]|uniref:Uncharacterized protein n=1 Tax=Cavenderia fasciculata TaxID=261658 RepID=F4Q8F0_CACFS|nr:uncharacterized protein DFA_09722 [Cavenderia fasciculata]EGG16050.1 hypothetical protein DFA_09722 [Cavenderia fasciculata]|eukprot:XP_004352375.1 hypothetical protein DFA_09722 [Cavenderia fasciculata]
MNPFPVDATLEEYLHVYTPSDHRISLTRCVRISFNGYLFFTIKEYRYPDNNVLVDKNYIDQEQNPLFYIFYIYRLKVVSNLKILIFYFFS